jgi:pyruvate/2-oxoglutarate dehydrogenase complex dihydrolipoamide acyltransferase (E2) component
MSRPDRRLRFRLFLARTLLPAFRALWSYISPAPHDLNAGEQRMATEITLPELGENVEGGDVVDIKVKEGADVAAGQALLEVEAEKSTVEVPSPSAGKITKVLVKKGENVKTGQALFVIEQGADGEAKARPAEEKKRPQPAHEEQETEDVKEEPAAEDEGGRSRGKNAGSFRW